MMKKTIVASLLLLSLTGCASTPFVWGSNEVVTGVHSNEIYYHAPPNVSYVRPHWVAPHHGMIWVYVPRYGWGWHHHHRGFHYRTPKHRHH